MSDFLTFKLKVQASCLRVMVNLPYKTHIWDRKVLQLIKNLGSQAKILDLGSGVQRRAPHVINLDIQKFDNVDVLGDAHSLPFKDNTFDAVILEAILEHVKDPEIVVSEVFRVLKVGGWVCVAVPFIQGYHASPEDYQRYTVDGLKHLLRKFKQVDAGPCLGPTCALHWIFKEYVGLLLSFGNIWLHKLLSLIIGWITFPITYLDLILTRSKNSHIIASAVFFIGQRIQ